MPELKRKRGRPPRPDAGNWEKFYVCIPLDVSVAVRNMATTERRSLSNVLAELVRIGVAGKLAQRRNRR